MRLLYFFFHSFKLVGYISSYATSLWFAQFLQYQRMFVTFCGRQPLQLPLHPSPHPVFFSHRLPPQLSLLAMSLSFLLTPHRADDQNTPPVLRTVRRGFLCIVVGLQRRMNALKTFFKKRDIKRHVFLLLRLSDFENPSEGREKDDKRTAG